MAWQLLYFLEEHFNIYNVSCDFERQKYTTNIILGLVRRSNYKSSVYVQFFGPAHLLVVTCFLFRCQSAVD